MRTSSYTIYVNTPEAEKVVLVNGLTGAVDVVSASVANYVHSLRKAGDEEWVAHPTAPLAPDPDAPITQPSQETLQRLMRRGYLTKASAEEEQQHQARIATMVHAKASQHPSFLLIPSYDCNLRCACCFQNDLRTKEENRPRLMAMTPERTDRIFAAIRMLRIGQLQITLDGPREVHNHSRVHKDGPGTGTFDKIVENISHLLSARVRIHLRVNVTRINAPRLGELAQIARERRWDTYPHFKAYVAPVHYPSKTPLPEGLRRREICLL